MSWTNLPFRSLFAVGLMVVFAESSFGELLFSPKDCELKKELVQISSKNISNKFESAVDSANEAKANYEEFAKSSGIRGILGAGKPASDNELDSIQIPVFEGLTEKFRFKILDDLFAASQESFAKSKPVFDRAENESRIISNYHGYELLGSATYSLDLVVDRLELAIGRIQRRQISTLDNVLSLGEADTVRAGQLYLLAKYIQKARQAQINFSKAMWSNLNDFCK